MRLPHHFIQLSAIAAATIAGFVVACGSDNAAAIPDDGGANGSDARADGAADGGLPPDEEGDATFSTGADAGCPLKFQGPRPGTVATSVPRIGTTSTAWSNPENARNIDGVYAHASLDVDQASEYLRVTGYGFTLPATVKIKGVVVEVKRQGNNQIVDGNIELWLDGMPSDRPKFVASGWPVLIGTHHYGQEIDTWGNDLTPELVGRAGFGTEIYAKRREDAGTGPASAEVESLRITIWYCE